MRVEPLLAKLRSAGAAISVEGSRVIIDAPVGALTDNLRAELIKHKTELISKLQHGREIREDLALVEARHEIAGLLAQAYHRYVPIGRATDSGNPGNDRLANSGGKSVHGVVQ